VIVPLRADRGGTVLGLDALQVGLAAVRLGAGRNRTEDPIDPAVGMILRKKPGDTVHKGDVLAEIHARSEASASVCATDLRAAYQLGSGEADLMPLWIDVIR
jgi:thymidine phosphorylase